MGLVTLALNLAVGLITGLRELRCATDECRANGYPELLSDVVYILPASNMSLAYF